MLQAIWQVLSGILSFVVAALFIGGALALFLLGGAIVTGILAVLALLGIVAILAYGIWEVITGRS
jgi:hypothetical protein